MIRSSTKVPLIETERLVLGAHCADDLPDVLATWSDPAVVRYLGGRASTEEEAWARIVRYAGQWPLLGYGFWRIGEKGSGRYVGDIGFFNARRGLGPQFDDAPEAGWTLAPWAHGRGLASEALQACLAWGDRRLPGPRTVCLIDPENAASIRVAEKFGYRRFTGATYKDAPVLLFERFKPS